MGPQDHSLGHTYALEVYFFWAMSPGLKHPGGSGLAILNVRQNPFKPLSLRVHLSNRGPMGVGNTLMTSQLERDPREATVMHVRGFANVHG